jgi:hypothetical protein
MAVISELTVHTGSMTFSSAKEAEEFIASMPSVQTGGFNALADAARKNLFSIVEQQLLTPSTYYSKNSYPDQPAFDYVMAKVDEPTLQAALQALGWTYERVISYTYD